MNQAIKERITTVPQGWVKKKLKDIGEFSKGRGVAGTQMRESGLPCIGYGDIYMKYDTQFSEPRSFIESGAASDSIAMGKGSLLFTATGETAVEIGKCVCYDGDEVIYVGGDIIILQTSGVNPLFVAYQQNDFPFIKQKARLGQGHSVVHIGKKDLEMLTIVYPVNPAEQDKIVAVLAEWDRAIAIQSTLITKMAKQRAALLQKMLVVKNGWVEKRIDSFLTKKSERVGNRDIEPVAVGVFGIRKRSDIFEKELSKDYSNNLVLQKGQLCFGIGTNSIVYDVLFEDAVYCVSPAYDIYEIRNIEPILLKSILDKFNKYFSKKFMIISARQGKSVDLHGLLHEKIKVPSSIECANISRTLVSIDSNLGLQKKKLAALKLQKQALMQLLLTGIVRTKGDE